VSPERLLESIIATLPKRRDDPPGSPESGSRNSPPIGEAGRGDSGGDRRARAATRGRSNAEQMVEYKDARADTVYNQAPLDTLGLSRMEPAPGMLDVVLRARQECQTNAT
jgi:hypothetical protein